MEVTDASAQQPRDPNASSWTLSWPRGPCRRAGRCFSSGPKPWPPEAELRLVALEAAPRPGTFSSSHRPMAVRLQIDEMTRKHDRQRLEMQESGQTTMQGENRRTVQRTVRTLFSFSWQPGNSSSQNWPILVAYRSAAALCSCFLIDWRCFLSLLTVGVDG